MPVNDTLPTEDQPSSLLPAGLGYLPHLLANAENITDATVRRPIGRVLTNMQIPMAYNLKARGEEARHALTWEGFKKILKDRPAWENVHPLYPNRSADPEFNLKGYADREPLWRAMFGLKPREDIDSKAVTQTGPNKFTLKEPPWNAYGEYKGYHDILGGHALAKDQARKPTTLSYRDFWDVAPQRTREEAAHPGASVGKTRALRRLLDIVTKTPTVEGSTKFPTVADQELTARLKKTPTKLPTYNDNAAWYKKDIGAWLRDKIEGKAAKLPEKTQNRIAKLLALGGKYKHVPKGKLGLLPGFLAEAANILHRGGWSKSMEAAQKANAGPSTLEALKFNLSNPLTGLAAGASSLWDLLKIKK